jgi:hypothetical protein
VPSFEKPKPKLALTFGGVPLRAGDKPSSVSSASSASPAVPVLFYFHFILFFYLYLLFFLTKSLACWIEM